MKKALIIVFLIILIPILFIFYKNRYLVQSVKNYIPQKAYSIEELNTLPGFYIDYFAKDVEGARSLTISDSGIVYVGTRKQGKVYALFDNDDDFKADETILIAENLNNPNGVVWHEGDLYVAQIDKITKFEDIDNHLSELDYKVVVLKDDLPTDTHHGWKYIDIGPDGKIYIPIGAPCNVCETDNTSYATLNRMNLDGTEFEVIARGIRNTVGFDWHPETKKLFFTENGRDHMGDNEPNDEFNLLSQELEHFGFPYCHGAELTDPQFGANTNCDEYTKPVQELGPHVAALGTKFYTGDMFPEKYKNVAFIAEHGSWNRSKPIGYRITMVDLESENYDLFIDGWLDKDGNAWGRPVDIEQMKDGSLLISDDLTGNIYRVTYK